MADSGVLTQAVDPASDRAVYKQIADHLREAIARSRLREGEQLPSEAQLMEHYGVARMTIRNALRVLQEEGLTAFNAEAAQIGATPEVDMLTVTEAQPPAEAADRLGVADDAEVVVRSRRYLLDGKPVETAVSYIPADLARGTPISDPNPGPGGIYARLEEQGHTLERFTEDVTAKIGR